MNSPQHKAISDRVKAGLHGPVRSLIEERTYPSFTSSDGRVDPELTSWHKTEYDRDGRIAAIWFRNSSRDHGPGNNLYVTRYTYTADGQLQRKTIEENGDQKSEILYHYDDRGRLQNITNSATPDNPIAFRYDANGRKTKISIARPQDAPEVGNGSAVSYSPGYFFGAESGAMSLPGGGTTVTLYDHLDRPIEVQIRNASGEIVYRTLREYDSDGNVLAEKQTMEDVLSIIPAAQQKKIIDDAGVSVQELRAQVAHLLGGGSEMSSTQYTFDAQGRETLKFDRSLGHIEQRVDTSYNEHGDIAKEISQTITKGMPEDATNETASSERIYAYEYDNNGNWTEKKSSSRQLPDGTLQITGEIERRTIEYY